MMSRHRGSIALVGVLLLLCGYAIKAGAMGKTVEAPRITKEVVHPMIGNPDLIIVDVRIGDEWTGSREKIQGAVREDPEKVNQWVAKYPKEKTIVFY